MRVIGLVLAVAAGAVGSGLSLQGPAHAQPLASPVIDRTMRCTTGIQAAVRELFVDAESGLRSSTKPSTWKSLASVEVSTPGTGNEIVASIQAGFPLESSPTTGGGLSVGVVRCQRAKAAVPLAPGRLARQTVRAYSKHWVCVAPARVLVHVHGTFRAPTSLQTNPFGYLSTLGGIARSSSLSVRTEKGRPLLFATVNDSGATRLYAASSCTEHS